MENQVQVSVVLPVYQTRSGWAARMIEGFKEWKDLMPDISFEWIIVDDGSPGKANHLDWEIVVRDLNPDILMQWSPNRGKGFSVRQAARRASGKVVVFTDADFPFHSSDAKKVISAVLDDGKDLAMAVKDEAFYREMPLSRRLVSRALRWVARILFRLPTYDTQCGLKAFSSAAVNILLATRINRFLFDLELVKRAARVPDLSIATVPCRLNPGTKFTAFSPKVLFTEFRNLIRILFT